MSGKRPEAFGKYQVEDLIAEGGMAEVFLAATPPPVVRRVAVKRIKPQHSAEQGFLEMFEDEARVAACFDHPNVVRVLDFEPGPPPYLVMEHVDGPDLRRLFWEAATKQQWMPVHIAAAIVAEAARGLHYAHTWKDPEGTHLQVIHRDMSPQNIMLTLAGAVKVLDFGIAKAAGRNTKTQAGIIKGKYAYMAPEQVRGETLSPRTDVFALGIILYESVTYKNPFRKDRDELTLIAVGDETPEPPRQLRPDLPEDLEAIILKALAKKPEERFQSALELAEAIDVSIASRRRPVRQEHIADFLRGIDALPLPGEAEVPVREDDREVSEADVRAASGMISQDAIAKAVAEAEAKKASARAEAQADALEKEATADDAAPADARARGLNDEDGDTGATRSTEPGEGGASPADADALLEKATRIQQKYEAPAADDGEYDGYGPLRPLTMPAMAVPKIPKHHRDAHIPKMGETEEEFEEVEASLHDHPIPEDAALLEKATRIQERYEAPTPDPEPGPEPAGELPAEFAPASTPHVPRLDAVRGSYPQALPPDWKLPVMIVVGLALLGGAIGAALAFLAG
ncbi:MAG: serine/threonine-protein kinase [Deltaproteobacteria bacterium]|nr:serine/threonine-protein kinase [Deltaproteobacteria bacterium]